MKGCELCPGTARMFCESDQASLCFDCDAKVHGANFLVARHSRVLLCRSCQSPTPWKAAGSRVGPTVSVCDRCSAGRSAIKKAGGGDEDEGEGESRERERVNDDEEVEDVDGDDDGDEDEMDEESDEEEDEEEEEGEEQVVPWSAETPPPPPPPASSSSSEEEESSSAARNGWLKRMRQNVDLPSPHYSRDQLSYSSSSRPAAALPKHKRLDLVRSGSNQLFGSDRPLT